MNELTLAQKIELMRLAVSTCAPSASGLTQKGDITEAYKEIVTAIYSSPVPAKP